MALLLLALLVLLTLWGLLRARARTPAPRWPPGPRPLPLIGNLHLLRAAQQDQALMQLAEQYGPVFTVHLGHQKTVVLTGYEAVKKALVGAGQELAGRPPIAIFQLINGGGGVFFSSGPRWRAARQLTVRALHGLGVGRAPVADKVLQELRCLMAQLDSYGGQPFPLALLRWAPSNITFALLFGQRFDYRDPVFVSLLGLVDEVMVLLGKPSVQLFNLYPRLGALLQLHRPVLRKIEEVRAILRALLEARRRRTLPRGPERSYLDALIQQGQGKDPEGLFTEANVVACVLDMVMAGTETTAATLQWAALLMGKHPRVQRHTRAGPAELRAPGRDAVGDAPPVQPRPLPGCRRALRQAAGLPAFLRRPPCLRGGEPGQVGAVPAVCGPPAEVPPAAPAGPQRRRPGHHTRPCLHRAAVRPGAVRRAQAAGALTARPG